MKDELRFGIEKTSFPKKINPQQLIIVAVLLLSAAIVVIIFLFFQKLSDPIQDIFYGSRDDNKYLSDQNANYKSEITKNQPDEQEITFDTDGDGLSDYEEKFYGTMLDNPDSDSDGFTDLGEIRDEYNPLGEGVLSQEMKKIKDEIYLDAKHAVLPSIEERYYKITADQKIPDDNISKYDTYYETDPKGNYDINIDNYCITEKELELANLINDYRANIGLNKISISKSLSYVAKVHIMDMIQNPPKNQECSMHSWSGEGDWESCCAIINKSDFSCVRNKPRELTDYPDDAVFGENALGLKGLTGFNRYVGAAQALEGWKGSHGHYILLANKEGWSGYRWEALGIAIYNGIAYMGVGNKVDPAGQPPLCSENDYDFCKQIKNKNLQLECEYEKVIRKSGYQNCDQTCPVIKDICVDNAMNHSSVCDQIGFYPIKQSHCYYKAAIYEKKPELCMKVIDQKERNDCYMNLSGLLNDEKICNDVSDDNLMASCFLAVAKTKADYKICDKIRLDSKKDNCFLHMAAVLDDITVCKNIKQQIVRDDCFSHQEINNDNLEFCKLIDNTILHDKCINQIAEKKSDIETCLLINNEDTKAMCIGNVCETISPRERKGLCIVDSNEKDEKIDWCYSISAGKARDYCFIGVARESDDYTICEKIEDVVNKDKCYGE